MDHLNPHPLFQHQGRGQVTCLDLNGHDWMGSKTTPVAPWESVENDLAQRGWEMQI